jgi:hypothetical protein
MSIGAYYGISRDAKNVCSQDDNVSEYGGIQQKTLKGKKERPAPKK